jgi:hypothetical protein
VGGSLGRVEVDGPAAFGDRDPKFGRRLVGFSLIAQRIAQAVVGERRMAIELDSPAEFEDRLVGLALRLQGGGQSAVSNSRARIQGDTLVKFDECLIEIALVV